MGILNLLYFYPDQRYSGTYRRVVNTIFPPEKVNKRARLTDQVGNTSMLLTNEQLRFIYNSNTFDGYNHLVSARYLVKTPNGVRLFPFAFEGDRLVLIYEKGSYGRLLSIGKNPKDSEAYRLLTDTCNPTTLVHCFLTIRTPVLAQIPLLQPSPLPDGSPNYWSIRLDAVT